VVGISKVQYTTDGEAFIIKREIKESQLKNPDYRLLKQWFHCDTVIRNDGKVYFCNHIKYIDFEEIIEK
jgi:protein associated with RNAse G/E